ncbi:hypothetical protein M8J71_17715 [Pseudarthrobacter sp. R1]|uniref:hypothetical protein n=1 Tax=Pseudarthrobacter sp. R1 TaxID=2944934 RepID=UPI00210869C7|nr:hypothetical protein [Pseudarthrobacter sp. R1]MCQ6272306.1 hypothetical protein [Pseudarthrobacter sp. R1]
MRYYGVVYDVGVKYEDLADSGSTVEPFDPSLVRHDLNAIANDLHANAVRIEGDSIERVVTAARLAHDAGLSVYFSPWKMGVGIDDMHTYLAEAAKAADELRTEGVDIVFVLGCEYSIFSKGIYPGEKFSDRVAWLAEVLTEHGVPKTPEQLPEAFDRASDKLNVVLRALAETVRASFQGPLTYSALFTEKVDWSIFDITGPNYYRTDESDEEYRAGLEYYKAFGNPVVVPEVGCCTYEGAGVLGAGGHVALHGVNEDGSGNFAGGVPPVRSEREQADTIGRELEIFADADLYGAFVFLFSFPVYPTGEGTRDLDLVAYSLVKTYSKDDPRSASMPPWGPKESFQRVADFYGNLSKNQLKE